MKSVFLSLLLLASSFATAKKNDDPTIQQRKEFCQKLTILLEQTTGWQTYVRIAPGPEQNVLQLYPGMTVGKIGLLDGGAEMTPDTLMLFKRQVVDDLLTTREQLKQLGFRSIQIKTSTRSKSFPKGTLDVPLD